MIDIITTIAKYLIIIMCLIYTLSCYTVFRPKNRDRKEDLLDNQVIYMFVFLFLCYTVLFLQEFELKILIFFAAQVIFFEILMIVFPRIYKRCSRPLINNTCFLLGVGFVILTRLSFDLAMKQFAIAAGSVIVTSFIPLMMHKITIWNKFGWLYAVAGFLLLSTVFVFGINKYGAYNWVSIAGLKFQPSEFVKIIFVFFVAALLSKAKEFKDLVKITVIAALYVLVLVVEKDLGPLVIFAEQNLFLNAFILDVDFYTCGIFIVIGNGRPRIFYLDHLLNRLRDRFVIETLFLLLATYGEE